MNGYLLTHDRFDGEVELGFNSAGLLIKWYIKGDVTIKVQEWLITHLPTEEKWVKAFEGKGFKVKLLPPDLSFNTFYDKYNNKNGKLEAERAWKRLPDGLKMRALERIRAYDQYCTTSGIKKQYPATYINKRTFEAEAW